MSNFMDYQKGWDSYMDGQPFNSWLYSPTWQKGYMDAKDFDRRCAEADKARMPTRA